ncbi:hypothetical protein CRM22_008242 [Opisthorchis felineus]|uniref:Uncharacterized protein n=1 Tax=Opisthorchis felineus TaxID=147828 RepID=A0A4S2LBY8_OPIFE|nr:hypothetical protein CRM22_008242 [Opisthorchis felineus]
MAKRVGFKVSILTPWTLLPENLSVDQCADEHADKFADVLCSRIRTKLLRFAFWPRARGEAYLCSSFDAFQERFLQHSEYAVIVLSGHHVSCLDSIYPRLLVFFTMRPSWSARFLLVFLGEPKSPFRFDTGILKHDTIIFNGSSEDHWASDEQSWSKLFRILKADYRSPSLEDVRNIKPKGWMSVTDLRGHHLAVKLVQTPHPSYMQPSSWNDLRYCGNDNPRKQLRDFGQQTSGLNFVSQSKPELNVKRYRTDSENSDQYDIEHRSASLPHLPITCISTSSGTARSSASPRLNSDLSPYIRRHAKPRFNEDPMKIEENEEEVAKEASEEDFEGVRHYNKLSLSPLNSSLLPDETKAGVMSPLIEENLEVTQVQYVNAMAHQVERNLTPSSSTACQLETLASGNIALVLEGYAPSENPPVGTVVESKRGILHGDTTSTVVSVTVEEHNKITGAAAEKDKPHPCACPESAHVPSRSPTDISSNPVIKVKSSSSSDSVLNAAPQTPPPSPMVLNFCPTNLINRIPSLRTNPQDSLDFASENTDDLASSYALAEQSKPYDTPGADWELNNGTNAKTLKKDRLDSEAGDSLVLPQFGPEDKEHEEKNLSTSRDPAYSNSAEVDTDNIGPAVDKMSEIKSGSNSPASFTSTDLSGHEPALNYAPLSPSENVQVQPAVPEGSIEPFLGHSMRDYANDDITESISVSVVKQTNISQVSHEKEVESSQSSQHQKETPLSEISDDCEYSGSSEDVQWTNLEFGVTALQSEVQEVTGRYLVECEEAKYSESDCLGRIILVSNPVPKQFAKPPDTDLLGDISVEPHGNNPGEERQVLKEKNWSPTTLDDHTKDTFSDESLVIDSYDYREFVENERMSNSTVPCNSVEAGEEGCLLKMLPDIKIQLENIVVTESSGEKQQSNHNQVTSSSRSEPHVLTSSSFLGTENLDQQGQQVSSTRREIVAFGQTFGQRRPRIWSHTGLVSLAEFLTGYIPRHLRWFYSSVFQSREELMDVMAGPTFTIQVHDGLRNPIYVTLAFLGIAMASPRISQWPQLVAYLFGSSGVYLYAPTIFIGRPVLFYLGRAWPWSGSAKLT